MVFFAFYRYIALCKTLDPAVSPDITEYIVESYVDMRRESRNSHDKTFTSARNLLAVIRLSTALARLRLAGTVEKEDVAEANRLLEMSKYSINCSDMQVGGKEQSTANRIFQVIRELAGDSKTIKVPDILQRCTNKGFKPDEIDNCIEEYEELNVWQVNQARTKVTFL